jgi:hypothetical protein
VQFSTDRNSTFLFVAASAGWEGSVIPLADVPYTDPAFPRTTTTDVTNLGIAVLQRNFTNNGFRPLQFIRSMSPIPLGVEGPQFAVTGDTLANTVLAVRDRIPTSNASMAFSYPAVVLYKYNTTANNNTFYRHAIIDTRINYRGKQFTYREEDFFGLGMGFSFTFGKSYSLQPINVTDPLTNKTSLGAVVQETVGSEIKYTICIAAPREAEGIYVYEGCVCQDPPSGMWTAPDLNSTTTSTPPPQQPTSTPILNTTLVFNSKGPDNWTFQQFLANPYNSYRSYFGGRQVMTADGRFLVASDAMSKTGRGSVYLYHRRAYYEDLYGYEQALRVNATSTAFNGDPIYAQNNPMYDRIGSFVKHRERFNFTSSQFWADQFGVGLAANEEIVVVGAPVEGCIYAYGLPPPCKLYSYNVCIYAYNVLLNMQTLSIEPYLFHALNTTWSFLPTTHISLILRNRRTAP